MKKEAVRLGIIGFVLGALLPAIATFNECARASGFSWRAALQLQLTAPTLWMLDTLPFILFIGGYLMGKRHLDSRGSREIRQLAFVLVTLSIVPLSLLLYVLELNQKSNLDIDSERQCSTIRTSALWPVRGASSRRMELIDGLINGLAIAYPAETAPLRSSFAKWKAAVAKSGPVWNEGVKLSNLANDLGKWIEDKRLSRQNQAAIELKIGMFSILAVLVMSLTILNRLWLAERLVLTQKNKLQQRNSLLESQQSEIVAYAEQVRLANLRLTELAAIVQYSDDAIISANLEGNITSWNGGAEKLFCYRAEEVIGRSLAILLPPGYPDEVPDLARKLAKTGAIQDYETKRRRRDGSIVEVSLRVSAVRDDKGELLGISKIARDITERRRYEQKIAQQMSKINEVNRELEAQKKALERANEHLDSLAMHDGLTGLKNHRALQERLFEECNRATRYSSPFSVLVVDVDYFKDYNDTYGHVAGDEVLQRLARLLLDNTRTVDFCARYGGEEFVLLLPVTDSKNAIYLAERLRSRVEADEWPNRKITVSIGVSTLSKTCSDPRTIIESADRALYTSKQRGRNSVTHADEEGFALVNFKTDAETAKKAI